MKMVIVGTCRKGGTALPLDVLSRFSFATATTVQQLENSFNNENTVKGIAFWSSVWKEWCLEKGVGMEIENYETT